MTQQYEDAKRMKAELEAGYRAASDKLKGFPKGSMGMTPDFVKNSSEFRDAKNAFTNAHSKLTTYNTLFLKRFKKEHDAERVGK